MGDEFLCGCHSLTALDLTPLTRLTSVGGWFLRGCERLTALDMTPLAHLTNVGDAFLKCCGLTGLDLTPLAYLTSVGGRFLEGCVGLMSLDLMPLVHLSNAVGDAFLSHCLALTALDLTPLAQVVRVGDRFLSSCGRLKALDLTPLVHLAQIGQLPPEVRQVDCVGPESPRTPDQRRRRVPRWPPRVDITGPDTHSHHVVEKPRHHGDDPQLGSKAQGPRRHTTFPWSECKRKASNNAADLFAPSFLTVFWLRKEGCAFFPFAMNALRNLARRVFGPTSAAGAANGGPSSTPGKIKVRQPNPLAVDDFLRRMPTAPSSDEIMTIIQRNYDRHEAEARQREAMAVGKRKAGEVALTPEQQAIASQQRDAFTRRVFFDVRYRCGCRGRCMTGVLPCRFPVCFHLRPLVKGSEVFEWRMQIESSPMTQAKYGAILERCRRDELKGALEDMMTLMRGKIAAVTATAPLSAAVGQSVDSHHRDHVAQIDQNVLGNSASSDVVSPACAYTERIPIPSLAHLSSSPAVEEIVALAVWRATLLVNLGHDEEAVTSLCDLCTNVHENYAHTVFASAANWAFLNDMEVRFYRMLDEDGLEPLDPVSPSPRAEEAVSAASSTAGSTPSPPLAAVNVVASRQVSAKATRRMLLGDVVSIAISFIQTKKKNQAKATATTTTTTTAPVEEERKEADVLDAVVNAVFGTLVTSIVVRAQTTQENGDHSEDPMKSRVVVDDVRALKRLGDPFWSRFEALALMPPMLPPRAQELESMGPNDTPRNVLDAVGRSMLLHHIAATYGRLPGSRREDEIENEDAELIRQSATQTPGQAPMRTPEEALRPLAKSDVVENEGATSASPLPPLPPGATPGIEHEYMSMPQRQRDCVNRMKDLLMLVKDYQSKNGGQMPGFPSAR